MRNPTRTTMIAKAFVLPKPFYPYSARIFRDHENPTGEYPAGYLNQESGPVSSRIPRRAPHPAGGPASDCRSTAVIDHPPHKSLHFQSV